MNNLGRMKKGMLYKPNEFVELQYKYRSTLAEYNRLMPSDFKKKYELMHKIFANVGECCAIDTPITSSWGCKHTHLGNYVFCNSNVTFIDDADIFIDDDVLIGPNVIFTTVGHPIAPNLRQFSKDVLYNYALPIYVKSNVWIGAGAIILPGITIGKNSVIGAGSVVTKDIPDNVVAYGVPCKVKRKIDDQDSKYYYKNKKIDIEEM